MQSTSNEKLSGTEKVVIAALMLATMTQAMGVTAVAPSLPLMVKAFPDASQTLVGMVITLPSLALGIFGLFAGALADRLGKERSLAFGALAFFVLGCLPIVLSSLSLVLVCRFVLGVSIALITVSTTAIIAQRYDGHMRARLLALQGAFMGIGIFLLEVAGGFLASFGWQVPFIVYVMGLPVFLVAIVFVRPQAARRDQNAHSGSPAAQPPDNHRALMASIVGACIVVFVFEGTNLLIPGAAPYLVADLHGDTLVTGLYLGCCGLAMTGGSMLQGRLVRSVQISLLMPAGFALVAIAFVGLMLCGNLWLGLALVCVEGIGHGLVLPSTLQWITRHVLPEQSGKAMGAHTMAFNLGVFGFGLLIEPVQSLAGGIHGLYGAFAVFALVCAAVLLACRKLVDR